jgi:exodeoxyribonuclease VII large subunit
VEGLHRLAAAMERRLAPGRQAVDLGAERLERRVRRVLEIRGGRLEGLAGKLHALSPLAILERGYSVARTPEGRVLRRVEDFAPGRSFLLRVVDGTVAAEATGPMEEGDNE